MRAAKTKTQTLGGGTVSDTSGVEKRATTNNDNARTILCTSVDFFVDFFFFFLIESKNSKQKKKKINENILAITANFTVILL